MIQDIIRKKVARTRYDKKYLLKVGLSPPVLTYLCEGSHSVFNLKPSKTAVRPFILKYIKPEAMNYDKINMRLRIELCEIRQAYMREHVQNQNTEILPRRSTRQRVSL